MSCDVMKCRRQGEHGFNLAEFLPNRPHMEAWICAEHDQAIRAGEPWLYDAGGHGRTSILMGDELMARDLRTLQTWEVVRDQEYTLEYERIRKLVLHTKTFGGERQDTIELIATPELVAKLKRFVERLSNE